MKYINIVTLRQFHEILQMYDIQLSSAQEELLLHALQSNTLAIVSLPYRKNLIISLSKQFNIPADQVKRLIASFEKVI